MSHRIFNSSPYSQLTHLHSLHAVRQVGHDEGDVHERDQDGHGVRRVQTCGGDISNQNFRNSWPGIDQYLSQPKTGKIIL